MSDATPTPDVAPDAASTPESAPVAEPAEPAPVESTPAESTIQGPDVLSPEPAPVGEPAESAPAEEPAVQSQAELDSPQLEKVDADDIIPEDASGPAVVVTDGSPRIPLQGPVSVGTPLDSNTQDVRVVAAQGTPTYYSNYADGESTGFEHPLDAPENRMQVVPGFSMPPGAGVGVPADLRARIDDLVAADEQELAEDEQRLEVDEQVQADVESQEQLA